MGTPQAIPRHDYWRSGGLDSAAPVFNFFFRISACVERGLFDLLYSSLHTFTTRSLFPQCVSRRLAATVLASDDEVFEIPFMWGRGRASLAATWIQDLVFSNFLMLVNCCLAACVMPESIDSRQFVRGSDKQLSHSPHSLM